MGKFLKMILATIVGCLVAVAVVLVLLIFFVNQMVSSSGNLVLPSIQKESILKIDLSRILSEREEGSPLDFLFQQKMEAEGLNQVLSAIKQAKENEKITGIYVLSGETKLGYATAESIRKALIDFKESKKFVFAYGENFNQSSYYVGSVADKIYMNPQGIFDFRGLAASIQFNKAVLKKLGIEMQVYRVGRYKSAVEPYTQEKMSEDHREQIMTLLSDIWSVWLQGISKSRKISVVQLNRYADQCLTFSCPDSIVSYKLIDGLKYADEMETLLKKESGIEKGETLHWIGTKELASISDKKKRIVKNKIAILYAEGEIIPDEMLSAFYQKSSIAAQRYLKELNRLKEDSSVKAVVFRINSPGGSAYASEQIWHAVKMLQKVKPVVVSMGDRAASGGYYIACGADKIVAEATTLTGSIGIFGLIPNGSQLAKQIGITHDHVSTHRHANMDGDILSIPLLGIGFLPARPLNKEESTMMQFYIERAYDLFLSRVSKGRNKTKEQIHAIAQGRVWSGEKALSLGLVDQLGNLDTALIMAAQLSRIKNYSIQEYPRKKDFFNALFEGISEKISEKVIEQWMGRNLYEQQKILLLWKKYDYRQALMFPVD